MKKLRICVFGHKRVPSREGGVEVVTEALCSRMVHLGHMVYCYNRRGHHVSGSQYDEKRRNKYKGIQIRYVWTINRRGLAAMSSSVVASIIAAVGKFDVVHIHTEGAAVFCWIPKLCGKKIICTIHGLDHKRAKWGTFAQMYILLGEKVAVKYADEIIVLSKDMKHYFKQRYGRETNFIPNGVSLPRIREVKKINELYGLEKDEYILFLGRIVPEKGVEYLIRAFKKIKTEKRLVIAGGASDSDSFMKHMQSISKDDKRIMFTGFVQGEILEELYSNAYIYVLPSDLEGMPLSLLEAMSYGNCCIVSDIAECAEVVEDKAVLFKTGDISELREKLQELCDDASRVRIYKNDASEFICKKYNWDDVTRKTLELYEGYELEC